MTERRALITVTDVNRVVSPDGSFTELKVEVTGTDAEARDAGRRVVEKLTQKAGAEVISVSKASGGQRGKSIGFSARNWNAPWQPTGPKPPWADNPQGN